MSESGLTDVPQVQQEGATLFLSWLASPENAGAQSFDPVRFHYLEVLAQRMDTAPGDVRRILESKLKVALADYGERFRQAQQAASDELTSLSAQHPGLARELQRLFVAGDFGGMRRLGAQSAFKKPCVPLAQLNQHLQKVKQEGIDHHLESGLGSSLLSDLAASSEMASVRRFRESWSRIAAEDQVEQSVGRGPANAGPMNSHMLVLRSLALMRKLSPDYLQRFLSHVETLLWLDQANQTFALAKTKPARRSRPKK